MWGGGWTFCHSMKRREIYLRINTGNSLQIFQAQEQNVQYCAFMGTRMGNFAQFLSLFG